VREVRQAFGKREKLLFEAVGEPQRGIPLDLVTLIPSGGIK
jgi:hypothetical protein